MRRGRKGRGTKKGKEESKRIRGRRNEIGREGRERSGEEREGGRKDG